LTAWSKAFAAVAKGRHRAGGIADERGPMSYYRIAEMAIALSFGLTFALVGWREIAEGISRALW
jgi:hypothetical protein